MLPEALSLLLGINVVVVMTKRSMSTYRDANGEPPLTV